MKDELKQRKTRRLCLPGRQSAQQALLKISGQLNSKVTFPEVSRVDMQTLKGGV